MRQRIYTLIEKSQPGDKASKIYDWYIMAVCLLSVAPLMSRESTPALAFLETATVYLLFFDYILRWMTHDWRMHTHSPWAFVLYPFTPFAVMDLLGILPTLGLLPPSFMVLRLLRLSKIAHYSKSCQRIANVFRKQAKLLLSVLMIAVAYIFVSALIMFVYEPAENFPTFFDSLYWATTALTTVGYGDIYPCTQLGKFVSMLSSFFGVAVIAMPASIVTAGFMDELNRGFAEKEERKMARSPEPADAGSEEAGNENA